MINFPVFILLTEDDDPFVPRASDGRRAIFVFDTSEDAESFAIAAELTDLVIGEFISSSTFLPTVTALAEAGMDEVLMNPLFDAGRIGTSERFPATAFVQLLKDQAEAEGKAGLN